MLAHGLHTIEQMLVGGIARGEVALDEAVAIYREQMARRGGEVASADERAREALVKASPADSVRSRRTLE